MNSEYFEFLTREINNINYIHQALKEKIEKGFGTMFNFNQHNVLEYLVYHIYRIK